jgi:hypothetical protein
MTTRQLAAVLARLPFVGPDCVLRIDKGVRDYLERRLKQR